MNSSRRSFLRKSLVLGATLAVTAKATQVLATDSLPQASTPQAPKEKPILVAIRNGSRSEMLKKALEELGGIEAFVKKGQSVLIKPNIGWNAPPERGSNTHPELVGALVTLCREAGASSVTVFDHTCDKWTDCYERSGIEEAVKAAGGTLAPGNDENWYRDVKIPGARILTEARIHRLALDSDVFINVPVLKQHSGSQMTCAMKNLMGVVWDRRQYHRDNLHQCIADFLMVRRPDLNIVDAFHPMFRNGPRGKTPEDTVLKRMLFASRDIVSIDAASAKVLDYDPTTIAHITAAHALGLGVFDLGTVDIRRHSLA